MSEIAIKALVPKLIVFAEKKKDEYRTRLFSFSTEMSNKYCSFVFCSMWDLYAWIMLQKTGPCHSNHAKSPWPWSDCKESICLLSLRPLFLIQSQWQTIISCQQCGYCWQQIQQIRAARKAIPQLFHNIPHFTHLMLSAFHLVKKNIISGLAIFFLSF